METEKKLNVTVKKVSKKSNEIEWTKTLEIPYKVSEKISDEEKKMIQEKYSNKDEISNVENINLNNNENEKMELNPFHQPNLNTIEFNCDDSVLIATIFKNNENNNDISSQEELIALEKLLENKIITQKEFNEKKEVILSKNN